MSIPVNKETSLLRALIETYMVAQGFHRTFKADAAPDEEHWSSTDMPGRPRTFTECVAWQMVREAAKHA